MKKLLILFIVFNSSIYAVCSQSVTIRGRVIAEDFETLPRVSIMINDTVEVGKTDLEGFFRLDIPASEKQISFDFVGMESVTIELKDHCDSIEVVMMYLNSYDFMSLKRAERKRKKRYKKLPEIHQKAFEKGIFKTDCACYKREFESFYLEKK